MRAHRLNAYDNHRPTRRRYGASKPTFGNAALGFV